jgi:two-component system OmpR family response regulator
MVPERHIAKSDADDPPIELTILSDARILVVDDDAQLRQLVTRLLRAEGYRATAVPGGQEMLELLRTTEIDLIVLDVMLPGLSGIELCRQVRQSSSVPILMLTARSEEADRVLGLEMGADDYLTKPFGSRELLARIRALLRRVNTSPNQLTNPDGVVIDVSSGEYDLLLAFLEAPQRVLTREQLLDMARNRTAVPGFDRSIDVQISRLRRKMGSEDAEGIIKTVRGAGYMFVANVARL